jgi:hypothetical protein
MSTEQTDQQPPPEWGAAAPPPPSRPRWTVRRTVIAVAIAVGIAGAGGVAIYAASGSVTADQGPRGGGGPMLIGGPPGGFEETQHGEFQVGEVTELTDKSITAKSEDGFTKTYVINSDTQLPTDVAKGDSVTIVATTEGATTTADSVLPLGAMDQRRGGPPQNGNGGPQNGKNGN